MKLSAKLLNQRRDIADNVPEDVQSMMKSMIEGVASSDLEQLCVQVGDVAPEFSLPNPDGTEVVLADVLAEGPVVLSFFRGSWCPFCMNEMDALSELVEEAMTFGARIIGVSPQTVEINQHIREEKNLQFELLSDQGLNVIRQYGLAFQAPVEVTDLYKSDGVDIAKQYGGYGSEFPVPATLILDRKGIVRYSLVDPDFMTRLDPQLILHALEWYLQSGENI